MLKNIISASDCAQCRLCCNFHTTSVWESPFIPEEQAKSLAAAGIEMERRARGGWSFVFRFQGDEAVNCPVLDVNRGCTFDEAQKPFECRIWPLRLMEHDGRLLIGRYRNCPALTQGRAERLDLFACGELLHILLNFVKENPQSLRPLASEYEIIWEGSLP